MIVIVGVIVSMVSLNSSAVGRNPRQRRSSVRSALVNLSVWFKCLMIDPSLSVDTTFTDNPTNIELFLIEPFACGFLGFDVYVLFCCYFGLDHTHLKFDEGEAYQHQRCCNYYDND